MKKHNEYALKGLKALQRAAYKVFENANKHNYKIPIWKNGHVVYEVPKIKTESGKGECLAPPPHTTTASVAT